MASVCYNQQFNNGPVPQPAQWNQLNNLREDPCARQVDETQSQLPGAYLTSNFFRPCESSQEYSAHMTEPLHQYKVYGPDMCHIPVDSQFRYAPLTNQGEIHQLFTRPYQTVPYMGAGQNSGCNKDLESRLIYSEATSTNKPCQAVSEATIDRFQCLPDYGNPQRVVHTIEPWVRGGTNTRDYVRRVNYDKFCTNLGNKQIVNKF